MEIYVTLFVMLIFVALWYVRPLVATQKSYTNFTDLNRLLFSGEGIEYKLNPTPLTKTSVYLFGEFSKSFGKVGYVSIDRGGSSKEWIDIIVFGKVGMSLQFVAGKLVHISVPGSRKRLQPNTQDDKEAIMALYRRVTRYMSTTFHETSSV